jgi:hypothetical protein
MISIYLDRTTDTYHRLSCNCDDHQANLLVDGLGVRYHVDIDSCYPSGAVTVADDSPAGWTVSIRRDGHRSVQNARMRAERMAVGDQCDHMPVVAEMTSMAMRLRRAMTYCRDRRSEIAARHPELPRQIFDHLPLESIVS